MEEQELWKHCWESGRMQSDKSHASIQLAALSLMNRYSDRNRPGRNYTTLYTDRHGFPFLSSVLMLMDISGCGIIRPPLSRENRGLFYLFHLFSILPSWELRLLARQLEDRLTKFEKNSLGTENRLCHRASCMHMYRVFHSNLLEDIEKSFGLSYRISRRLISFYSDSKPCAFGFNSNGTRSRK